jgi:type I restriction enzyme S subunit
VIESSRWPTVLLSEVVAETQYGTSLQANEHGVGVPVLRMNNITYSGAFDLAELKHVELPRNELERYSVRRGDLLFNRTNSQELVGKMGVWSRDEPYAFAGYLVRLRVKRERADPAFVAAWFNTPEMKALLRARAKPSINMSNINATEILNFPVIVPPLDDQRRIAEVLNRAEALRAKRRAALAQLDTLARALFLDRFGDPIQNPNGFPTRPLIDLVDPHRPISYGILMPGPDQEKGVKYVRVVDMKAGGIEVSGLRKTSETISNAFRRSLLRRGDLLMSIRGHVGRCAIVPPELDGANITQDTARLAVQGASSIFVRECLSTGGFQRWMAKHTKGVAVRGINLSDVKLMPIILPPREEQDTFARLVAAVDRVKATHRASLAEMDALFAAIQNRAFRGRP